MQYLNKSFSVFMGNNKSSLIKCQNCSKKTDSTYKLNNKILCSDCFHLPPKSKLEKLLDNILYYLFLK